MAESLLEIVQSTAEGITVREKTNPAAVEVPVTVLGAVLHRLKTDSCLGFDLLVTHTAVDWIEQGQIELFYDISSTAHGHRLMVCCRVPRENPVVPTVMGLWRIAEWQEREVYDMFGVLYDGHTDLRRVLLEDTWVGHPLRKDYRDDNMIVRPR